MSDDPSAPDPVDTPEPLPGDPAYPVEVTVEEHPAPQVPPEPAPEPPLPDGPVPDTAPVVPVSGGEQEEIA